MSVQVEAENVAHRLHVRGIVQGVGFRPFVYRLAHRYGLNGWVLNGESGVEVHVEGDAFAFRSFYRAIETEAPPAAKVSTCEIAPAEFHGFRDFVIRQSEEGEHPTVRVSPDIPVCRECLEELFDPNDRRYGYPYINCTNCGPRYSIILELPYDRPMTTMKSWPMCAACEAEYHDPANRRFHAQPIACRLCGPAYYLQTGNRIIRGTEDPIRETAALLRRGNIIAIKSLGGYHLACDARNAEAIRNLRTRKYRKERPFALMVRDTRAARELVDLSPESEALMQSIGRPIVLARSKVELDGVAPDTNELGVMLPYTPLQHLLFAANAPSVLVMTSANRSSEPISYVDADAIEKLDTIADAFLIGEREIARRVDDSVARAGVCGPAIMRHARGYAPEAVAVLPVRRPILAVGAELKSAITLVVDGQAFASQHIGDLEDYQVLASFKETIADFLAMYEVDPEDLLVVRDAHPEYASTAYARNLPGKHLAIQHHRAHIASVLAERGALETNVIGVAFDGAGYGDDGSIWGGEFFLGSVREGFTRVAALRTAALPGGDAAAQYPVQAAAGFLSQIEDLPDITATPFDFPDRYVKALKLVEKNVRAFPTSSVGRLFDTVAALLGFTRKITFEAQAAMWLEQLALQSNGAIEPYPFPVNEGKLDFRPLLAAVAADRKAGKNRNDIAWAFHAAIADGIVAVCAALPPYPVAASGGVFQNALLLELLSDRLGDRLWTNRKVPANDGGISLGQATLAAAMKQG